MAIKKILKMGNPLLRQEADPVSLEEIKSDNLKYLVEDIRDTLEYSGGIGLAAPQIGILKQLVIIKIPEDSERYPESEESEEFILLNPVISCLDTTLQGFWEGCLSIPGIREDVERHPNLTIEYFDRDWNLIEEDYGGIIARVIQHEYDHIEGILFTDLISGFRKRVLKGKLKDIENGDVDVTYKMRYPIRKK